MDIRSGQELAWENKLAKRFNTTNIPLEFCLLQAEIAEAFREWRKGGTNIGEELADAVRAYPERIGGFATLALKAPDTAAAELERCVTRLGFHGALVNGTTGGLFLDDPRFLPVLEEIGRASCRERVC